MSAIRDNLPLIEPASADRTPTTMSELECDSCGARRMDFHAIKDEPGPCVCICGAVGWSLAAGHHHDYRTLH